MTGRGSMHEDTRMVKVASLCNGTETARFVLAFGEGISALPSVNTVLGTASCRTRRGLPYIATHGLSHLSYQRKNILKRCVW